MGEEFGIMFNGVYALFFPKAKVLLGIRIGIIITLTNWVSGSTTDFTHVPLSIGRAIKQRVCLANYQLRFWFDIYSFHCFLLS